MKHGTILNIIYKSTMINEVDILFGPITIFLDENPVYQIVYNNNFNKLNDLVSILDITERKVCIITDSNISKYYLNQLSNELSSLGVANYSFVFKAGEDSKNTSTIEDIYGELIRLHFDRNDVLFALGGGVTGDMTGYAAATYLRGIRFVQIPTSLLAMVDSSIGGKTGVDFNGYKNMVGAFHMPSSVLININVLSSLPDRDYFSGFGEIIKHALIQDEEYFKFLCDNSVNVINRKDSEALLKIIYRSNLIKKNIVEEDPNEKGKRALLNFGHTIGHAIEKYMDFKLLHGECVALGSVASMYISLKRGLIQYDTYTKAKNIFKQYRLPVNINERVDINEIIKITKSDKKYDGKNIKFILLKDIGDAFIDLTVSEKEMHEALIEISGGHNE